MVSPIPMMLLFGSWAYPALRPPRRFGQHEVSSHKVSFFSFLLSPTFVTFLSHGCVFVDAVPFFLFLRMVAFDVSDVSFLRLLRPWCWRFLFRSFPFSRFPVPRFDRVARTVGSSLCLYFFQRLTVAWHGRGSISIGVVGLGVRRLAQCGRVGCVSVRGTCFSMGSTSHASTTHMRRRSHVCGELRHGVGRMVFRRPCPPSTTIDGGSHAPMTLPCGLHPSIPPPHPSQSWDGGPFLFDEDRGCNYGWKGKDPPICFLPLFLSVWRRRSDGGMDRSERESGQRSLFPSHPSDTKSKPTIRRIRRKIGRKIGCRRQPGMGNERKGIVRKIRGTNTHKPHPFLPSFEKGIDTKREGWISTPAFSRIHPVGGRRTVFLFIPIRKPPPIHPKNTSIQPPGIRTDRTSQIQPKIARG